VDMYSALISIKIILVVHIMNFCRSKTVLSDDLFMEDGRCEGGT
jgi:hypothetical protein